MNLGLHTEKHNKQIKALTGERKKFIKYIRDNLTDYLKDVRVGKHFLRHK
jgi:hypothetical protein